MAFNQNRAGAPNSAAGRAAEAVENRAPGSAVGRAAGNYADREEMKHGQTGAGFGQTGTGLGHQTGTGLGHTGAGITGHNATGLGGHQATGLGARGVGLGRDEQYAGERLQGVSGVRSETTGQGAAYCPNPNDASLPKEFETRVQVIEKVPEMKTVTKTDYVKRLDERTETVTVPKTKVVMEDVERVDMVPHVREIPKTRTETRHRVVEEQVEVPYTEKVVVNVPVPRRETVPRVVTEQVQTTVRVPIVTEVPVQRQVEVPTGNYCETPIDNFAHAGKGLPTGLHGEKVGHHHGINKPTGHHASTAVGAGAAAGLGAGAAGHKLHRSGSSSSSSGYSSSDDEKMGGKKKHGGLASKLPGHHKTAGTTTGVTGAGLAGQHGAGTHGGLASKLPGHHATGVAPAAGAHPVGTHPVGTHPTTGLAGAHHDTTAAPKKKSLLQKIEDKIMPGHGHH